METSQIEERRIRFEARKLAVELLVKIHLEHLEGSRHLVMNHYRLNFGLSLSAVAGLVTLYAAAIRLGAELGSDPGSLIRIGFALLAIGCLVASAMLATRALRKLASSSAHLLRDPFPNAETELAEIFENPSADETSIVRNILQVMKLRVESEPAFNHTSGRNTFLLVLGVIFGLAPFVVVWPLPM